MFVLQVESQVEESGLVLAGLYHAHDNLKDTHIDVFSQRIADKVLTATGDRLRYGIYCFIAKL